MNNIELENKICESIEKTLDNIIGEDEIREEDVEFVGQLIDIKKDIANMEYWKIKEEDIMRYMERGNSYGTYGTYGRNPYGARRRDSRGRYMEGGNSGNYGRRYRGHDMIDEMAEKYGNYMESSEGGRYGADTMQALEYMLQSVEDFMCTLEEDAKSPEEIDMIKQTAQRIASM